MKRVFVFLMKFIVFVCIFAAIFVVSAYVGYLYITPSSYVSLNTVPLVRFSVNTFDRVIKVDTDNENEDIINKLELNNMKVYEAVQKTVDEFVSAGYISNNSSLIISVSNKDENKTNNLMRKLQEKVKISSNVNSDIQMVKVELLLN